MGHFKGSSIGFEEDLEVDLDLLGESKGDLRGDFKRDLKWDLLSSSGQVRFGPGLVQLTLN